MLILPILVLLLSKRVRNFRFLSEANIFVSHDGRSPFSGMNFEVIIGMTFHIVFCLIVSPCILLGWLFNDAINI
jgi:hypothetical protein